MSVQTASMTPEQYLAQERVAETRSEYFAGMVYAMSGASRKHNRITGNCFASLHLQLTGKPGEALVADMRVRIAATGSYAYPDIAVACAPLQFDDAQTDTLLNPTVILEVLSPSTANYDRGLKLRHYRSILSLVDYLLVDQEEPRMEWFHRQIDGDWTYRDLVGLDATFRIESIDCALSLREAYAEAL